MSHPCPQILNETEYANTLPAIRAELDALRQTEVITSADGCQLYCERYIREGNTANLLIVHGFTEFSAKYTEQIHLFLEANFNVFIYDQRGHGFSGRLVADLRLAHVDQFEDYAQDLDAVIEQQVVPFGKGLPLYLFTHSMGGAAAALYLAGRSDRVQKAILTAPMVRPLTRGVPRPLVLQALRHFGRKDGWDQKFPFSPEFSKTPDFNAAPDDSYARFKANLDIRIRHPEYQNSSATNRWMLEALTVERALLKAAPAIQTPILLISAGQDRIVCNKKQLQFAKKLPACRYARIEEAKHTVFAGTPEILKRYYSLIFDFLNE